MRSLLLGLLLLSAPALAEGLNIKGSDTMVVLVQRWAEAFMKVRPEFRIQVNGGGTGTGIAALANGSVDLASASRAMKPKERDAVKGGVKEYPAAKDGVAFFVHASNPVRALTKAELQAVYLGDLTNWKDLGGLDAPIVLYSRENSSGTYSFVKEHLLDEQDFAAEAQTLPGTAAVVDAVSQEPNAIGYGGSGYAKGVRELPMRVGQEDVPASLQNVRSGKYPLSRDLFFYAREPESPAVRAFLEFCLSEAGQRIVLKVGYFPLK